MGLIDRQVVRFSNVTMGGTTLLMSSHVSEDTISPGRGGMQYVCSPSPGFSSFGSSAITLYLPSSFHLSWKENGGELWNFWGMKFLFALQDQVIFFRSTSTLQLPRWCLLEHLNVPSGRADFPALKEGGYFCSGRIAKRKATKPFSSFLVGVGRGRKGRGGITSLPFLENQLLESLGIFNWIFVF